MMTKSPAEKMRLRPGSRAFLAGVPVEARTHLMLPALELSETLEGDFDYLHLFVTTRAALDRQFPRLARHLAPGGMLFVSWPKAKKLGTDLDIKSVIAIGYKHGLVESTALSIDAVWSALKFTHPKPGKIYDNSYGTLGVDRLS